jgi:hypothetical protein
MVPKCSALHLFACENTGAAIWSEDCRGMPLEQTEGEKIANRRTILGGLLQVGCGAECGFQR